MSPANDQPNDQPNDQGSDRPKNRRKKRPAKATNPATPTGSEGGESISDQHAEQHIDPLVAMAEVLDAEYLRVMRYEPMQRCFGRAVADVGLPVPGHWASFDDQGMVSFRPMTAQQFRRLVNVLEQVADRMPEPVRFSPLPDDEDLFAEIVLGVANEAIWGPDFASGFTDGDDE